MPYKPSQCRLFGAKSGRGERVPQDWREECRGVRVRKGVNEHGERVREKGEDRG
jgi:hypothetical protein